MATRKFLLLCSLSVLLVEADLETNDGSIQTTSTDKDSTSDEAPTESLNGFSPDQPDEAHFYREVPSDTSSTSAETGAENVAAPNSEEEDDEEDSAQHGKKSSLQRSSKAQPAVPPPQPIVVPQPQPIVPQPIVVPQPVIPQPVIPQPIMPQPIMPQPRSAAQVRSRAPSKRRSRNNRRQM